MLSEEEGLGLRVVASEFGSFEEELKVGNSWIYLKKSGSVTGARDDESMIRCFKSSGMSLKSCSGSSKTNTT